MNIIHIAKIDKKIGGVNTAVPQHIIEQQKIIPSLKFVNLAAVPVEGVNCQMHIESFLLNHREILNDTDLVVFHEVYYKEYLKVYKTLVANDIPYIIVPHGSLTNVAQKRKHIKKKVANILLFNDFINNAASIQCLSYNEAKNIKFNVNKFIGTNGVNVTKKKRGFSQNILKYIFIGRLDIKIKGLDLLVEAIKQEAEFIRDNKIQFEIYGPNENNSHYRLNEYIKKRNINDIVAVYNAVEKEQKESVLLSADCFIQTSRTEGMSMGLIEALGFGLPCIVSEGTGLANTVNDYNAGWGCKTDVQSIALAIRSSIQAKDSFPLISHNAIKLVENEFSWHEISKNTVNEYKKRLVK